jgi:hypothetical protein
VRTTQHGTHEIKEHAMGFSALGRSRLAAAPALAAMMLVGGAAAAQAAPGPRAGHRTVAVTTQAPETASYGGGTNRRFTGTVTSLDDIRQVVS